MRSLLMLVILLGNAAVAVAQAAAKTYGERLEAVHSAASLYAFMGSLPPEAGHIDSSQDSLLQFAGECCFIYQIHSDSVEASELDSCARFNIPRQNLWSKMDFDEDGRLDLFFNNGYGHAYAVMNRGAQLPLVIPLILHGNWRDCQAFSLINRRGTWLIGHLQIFRRRHNHAGRIQEPQVWQDTLAYHLGAFVEYNARPNPRLPKTIGFKYRSGGPPPSSGYDILIHTKTGWVKRQKVRYKDFHAIEKLRYRLRPGALDTLRQQLAYLNIAGLSGNYAIYGFDASKVFLAFHYSHQPPKQVDDYGLTGTYGLQRLYDLVFESYEHAEKQQEAASARKKAGH